MLEQLIPSASTYAGDIDWLIDLIAILTGFWFLVAQGMLFYLIFKYREENNPEAEYLTGKEKEVKRWVTIPHLLIILCDIVIIVAAVWVWRTVKQTLPEPDAEVRVVGQQWAWSFQHPGPDGELDTEDDIHTVDELHVEKGKTYHFDLESKDVIHSFSVPAFRLKQDAIPGRSITGWFEPTKTGTYDIQCAEICGIGHGLMVADLHVETPEEHAAWLEKTSGD